LTAGCGCARGSCRERSFAVNAALISALLGHWWRNPVQLVTLLAGLALGTALWSGVQAINAEARASYEAAAATLGEGRLGQIRAADGGPLSQATYVALRRAGWDVSPVIEGRLGPVRLVGIEPLTAPGGVGPAGLRQGGDLAGFLTGPGQILGRAETLARLPETAARAVLAPDAAPNTAITDIRGGPTAAAASGPDRPADRSPPNSL